MVRFTIAASCALLLGSVAQAADHAAAAWAIALASCGVPTEASECSAAAMAWSMALSTPQNCACGCSPTQACECKLCQCCNCCGDYGGAYKRAVAEGKRLVVFVGEERREIDGMVTVVLPTFAGLKRGVVVGVPDGKGSLSRVDLPAGATEVQIRSAQPKMAALAPPPRPVAFAPAMFGMNCVGGV